ncbi:hypothetical protein ACMFMG_010991 [Clarireedia jacksonii]
MHFSKFFIAAFVGAASAAPAAIQQRDVMTSAVVVANINTIKVRSADLTVTVEGIKFSPLAIIQPATFKLVVDGFTGIITIASNDITAMQTTPIGDLTVAGQTDVCDAFRDFVKVHQNLLSVLISKSGILTQLGGGPIAEVLRSLEEVVDSLALGIIGAIPTCADGAKSDLASLDVTIQKARCAYIPLGSVLPIFCN